MGFPPIPPCVKSIAHILKVAEEYENRNIVVTYWARMYACQSAIKLIPKEKPPEVSKLLVALMDWLEQTKQSTQEEGILNETVGQAIIESDAMQLFKYADTQDRAENFNKNTIKTFYTAGILMDILEQFGEQTDDIKEKKKYAKWKAAFIHNCLKNGETPIPGGPDEHLKNVIDISKDPDDPSQRDLVVTPRSHQDYVNPRHSNVRVENDSEDYDFGDKGWAQPKPDVPNEQSGADSSSGFAPAPSIPATTSSVPSSPQAASIAGPEEIQKAQKYCKYATSALNYDDVKTAVENLSKALNLLQTGRE